MRKLKAKKTINPVVPAVNAETVVTQRVKKPIDISMVKEFNPRDPDVQYFDTEPKFITQPDVSHRLSVLAKSFTWYHRFCTKKHAKDFLCQYLTLNKRVVEAKTMHSVDESFFKLTMCWLARMELRGLQTTEQEEKRLEDHISYLLGIANNSKPKNKSATGAALRPNVQEIMKEKAKEAAGEIEGMFDAYIKAGSKATFDQKPIDELVKKNVLPQHISIFIDAWQSKKNEIEEVLEGKDSQLVEGYSRFTKPQLKNILKFIETCLSDFNSYVSMKKAAKAPRKRKAVSPEKQVAKLKHLKAFKDAELKLDLVGVSPTKLLNSSEAWIYDTDKRKLHHYVADQYNKVFSVKGNTLLGFDSKESEIKKLRKPEKQLKEVMGSKPAARKFFKEIRAQATTPKGRFNESMIILKAF